MASSPGRRILIVTASDLWRNPRVVKEARALAAAGFQVEVQTISTGAASLTRDQALLAGSGARHTVLTQPDGTPAQRVAALRDRLAAKAARWARRRLGRQFPAALGPARRILRAATAARADLTIGHVEVGLWAACALLRRGRRVAVDFEDWYSEDLLPAEQAWRPRELLRDSERAAVAGASYWSAPSESMVRALRTQAGVASGGVAIRNCFPLLPPRREAQRGEDAPLRVAWFSQTVGPGRGLEWFLRGWAAMRAPRELTLIGSARESYADELLGALPAEVRARIRLPGVLSEAQLDEELCAHDVGLALEQREPPSRDHTITNKLLQSMNASLAVLATATAGQREVLSRWPAAGLLVDPADDPSGTACAQWLDALATDQVRLASHQRAARTAAEEELCWERESAKLVGAVEGALRQTF